MRETRDYNKNGAGGQRPPAVSRQFGIIPRDDRSVDKCSSHPRVGLHSRRSKKNLSTMSDSLWQRGCVQLAAELPEQQFNTWIRPLPPGEVSAVADANGSTVIVLRVPNRFKLDWIRSQYAGRIEGVLSGLAGGPVKLDLQLAPRDSAPSASFPPTIASTASTGAPASDNRNGLARPSSGGARLNSAPLPSHRLNAALTFETLVAGRANQMARTAALHVAGAP